MTDEEILQMWPIIADAVMNSEPSTEDRTYRQDCILSFARRIAEIEREECAKEAEHWQLISTPEHKCGDYIAAAIRARGEK